MNKIIVKTVEEANKAITGLEADIQTEINEMIERYYTLNHETFSKEEIKEQNKKVASDIKIKHLNRIVINMDIDRKLKREIFDVLENAKKGAKQ